MEKNWCFPIVVSEKTLESPLDCKINPVNPTGNKSWIFIGRTDVELKLQYFGHLMWRSDSLEWTLTLGKSEGKRRRKRQRKRWLDSITDGMNVRCSKPRETVEDRGAWFATVHVITQGWTGLSDWTATRNCNVYPVIPKFPFLISKYASEEIQLNLS